jgi:hypothetical protein
MIDRYTKIVLTVIALSLAIIAAQGFKPRVITTRVGDSLQVSGEINSN